MTPRVVVVGLGPGDPTLLTTGTVTAIERTPHRFIRTTRHPSAPVVEPAASFDHHYETGADLAAVYAAMVEDLVAGATRHGEVLYAVPGSPVVAERAVELLGADERVETEILPALSFTDLAWSRLGVDPVAAGASVIDGQRFAVEAAERPGSMLVAQCDRRAVLSEIKLALDGPEPPTVTVLQRLGLPDEAIFEVPWDALDRDVEPDHLTSLWIPEWPEVDELRRFVELVAVLRRECPWDAEQTHQSLTRHLIEETAEVIEAIDGLGADGSGVDHLQEELGDLLFQVVFHATLGAEAGAFDLADVARGVHDKLVARHPHVFAATEVEGTDDVVANWEDIKRVEKGRDSVFDGIPAGLPALLVAGKVERKAVASGLVGETDQAVGLEEALRSLGTGATEDSVARALTAVVLAAVEAGVDPEAALRRANGRREAAYRDRE